MFKLCFGKGKTEGKKESNNKKKIEIKAEEEKNQIENRIKIKFLTIELENYQAEISINDEIILLYKKGLDEFTKSPSNDSNDVVSILRKENNILKHSIDSLNSKIQITESSLYENQKEIDNILDENSEINKIESKIFILKNLFFKKEHEILNLENFLKNIKKRKTPITIEITNCDDTIFNKILNDELLHHRNNYTKLSKLTISEKSKINEKKRKIEEMKKEIEIHKNPNTYASKHRTNLSENDIEKNFNLNLNSNNNNENNIGNVNLNSLNLYNQKSNKSDFYNYKNEDSAVNKLNTSLDFNNEEKLNKMNNELASNKETIKKLTEELNEIKTSNSKVESEISNLNNNLSTKFCFIYKLEKKLDKLRNKIKVNVDINENVAGDKIHKKISLPISTKLNLHNTTEFSNPKRLQTTFEMSKLKDINK